MKPFSDRFEAGRFLVPKLAHFRERPGAMVLALAKGGVPVAYEIAKDLHIATDLILYSPSVNVFIRRPVNAFQ
jgi:putative phosphoribosyl transferase